MTGEEIVAGDDIYGGSDRLLSQVIPKTGVVVKLVLLSFCLFSSSVLFFGGAWTKNMAFNFCSFFFFLSFSFLLIV